MLVNAISLYAHQIKDPDIFKCVGETDIDKTYEMPKSVVTYRKPRRLSDEQREAAKKRMITLDNH